MSDIIEKFSDRLEKILKLRDLKPVELHEKTGISESLISKYLSDNAIARTDKLTSIANALNVNPVWLMGYDVPMERNSDKNIQGVDKKAEGSAIVLIYGSIPAGTPMEMIEDIIDTEEIPVDMLRGGKEYFGLRVKGNSMNPEYLDGDNLIILKQDDCESGDDCIVMVNGNDGTFKRVIKNEEKQTIKLQPLNTTLDENGNFLYEPITFTKDQIEQLPVRILGVVEEIRRRKKRK